MSVKEPRKESRGSGHFSSLSDRKQSDVSLSAMVDPFVDQMLSDVIISEESDVDYIHDEKREKSSKSSCKSSSSAYFGNFPI